MTEPADAIQDDGRSPSFRQLLDWVEGRLTRSDAGEMDRRVRAADPATKETVRWIGGFIRFGRRNPLPEPPPILRQRLRQSFQQHHGVEPEPIRQAAALSFDSRDDAVLAGVRGGFEIDEGYHLAFAGGSIGVLLDVIPEGGRTVRIDGQVLSADDQAPVWEARVDHPGGTLSDIGGDRDGCFALGGVPIGATRLWLSNGLVEIEIVSPLGDPGA